MGRCGIFPYQRCLPRILLLDMLGRGLVVSIFFGSFIIYVIPLYFPVSVARGAIVKTGSSFVCTSGLHTPFEYFETATPAPGDAVWDFYDP